MNRVRYFDLFISFAKVGILTFGGGMAMLPMLESECTEKHGWASKDEMLDYFAVGQCTPGIIAVNTATFIGYKNRGVSGAVVATLGIVFPSFFIILLLAGVLNMFSGNEYLNRAFVGIRIAVCSLLSVSVYKAALKSVKSVACLIIAVTSLVTQLFFKISPVISVILTLIYGVVVYLIRDKNNSQKSEIAR